MAHLEALASKWLENEIETAITQMARHERDLVDAKRVVDINQKALDRAIAMFDALTWLAEQLDQHNKEDQ